jgi:signal transduction histidine kinase
MNSFAISAALTAIAALSFGFIPLLKGKNRSLARIWFLFSISVASYEVGAVLFSTAKTANEAAYYFRISYMTGVLWIPSTFLHFVYSFLELRGRRGIVVNYLISALWIPCLYSGFFVDGARWVFGSMYYPHGGKIFWLYLVWWMGLVVYSHYLLYRHRGYVSTLKRLQIKYFFLATALGFSGGCSAYLPNLGFNVYPWGNFTVFCYPFIVTYAIVKHQLMDIQIVIRKAVVSIVGLILGIVGYITFVVGYTHREITPLANFSILTGALSAGLATFVLFKAPKTRLTLLWIGTCVSIAIWSFGFGMMTRSLTLPSCLFWQRWGVYLGAIMIPTLYLHFVAELTCASIPRILVGSYFASAVFEVLNFTGYLATASLKPPFLFYTDAIFPAYHLYTLFFLVVAVYAHWLLIRRYRTADGNLKNQTIYVFIGTAIGFVGGAMTFPLSFNIHVFPIGTYLVAFYIVSVTYSIYKHRLMDIQLAIRKSVVNTVLTACLTAFYICFVSYGARFAQAAFGDSTLIFSIAGAFLLTVIFMPLRNRVQRFFDRYFFSDWSDQPIAREIAAGFSHELKSPLAGLSMQAQLALQEIQDAEEGRVAAADVLPKIKEALRYLVSQSSDAARRIEAVRGVAEPAEGQIEPVDIPAVIDNSLAYLERAVHETRVTIRREMPKRLPAVRSNAKQLEIVFINLIKNALQAMETSDAEMGERGRGGILTVAAQEREGLILISVKDTGPGIATKDIGHIFEPHFSTKGRKGTGMGLYLTHQIVKAHGGSIEVSSEPNNGTQFVVHLPKYETRSLPGSRAA